jgi:hypothetical protein
MRIVRRHGVNPRVQLRVTLSEAQAEKLLQRLSLLPFNLEYQQKLHGALVDVVIDCTTVAEQIVRNILHELGASTGTGMEV